MSSVIVKGMQMPSECRMCPLCRYFYSTGVTRCMLMQTPLAEDYKDIRFDGRHENCPLVELPEKHGDLIDRNKLLFDIEEFHLSDGKFQYWVEVQNAIVEAEGKCE